MKKVERTYGPTDRLGRIGDRLARAMEADPEYREGDRCVFFMEDSEICCTVLNGFDQDAEAIAAVFAHMAAVFEANGMKLKLIPIPRP